MRESRTTDGFEPPWEEPEDDPGLEYAPGVLVAGEDTRTLYDAGEFEALKARLWSLDVVTANVENNRGCVHARLGERDEAIQALERALKAPGSVQDLARAGRNLERLGRGS